MSGSKDDFDSMATGHLLATDGRDFDAVTTGYVASGGVGGERGETLRLGTILDERYLVSRVLGHGGMGTVYQATDVRTQVQYAVKVLQSRWSKDPTMLNMLAREVAHAQQVTHQNLLKVNGLEDRGPHKYLVMD